MYLSCNTSETRKLRVPRAVRVHETWFPVLFTNMTSFLKVYLNVCLVKLKSEMQCWMLRCLRECLLYIAIFFLEVAISIFFSVNNREIMLDADEIQNHLYIEYLNKERNQIWKVIPLNQRNKRIRSFTTVVRASLSFYRGRHSENTLFFSLMSDTANMFIFSARFKWEMY